MYKDEIFENALKESKEESYRQVKKDVKTVEELINKFLTQLLECSTINSERDFFVCGI